MALRRSVASRSPNGRMSHQIARASGAWRSRSGSAVARCAVALTAIGIVFAIGGSDRHGAGAVVAIVALAVYTGSFAIGLGPVFWLLISELYPQHVRGTATHIRGTATSVATMANWVANFVVTISFLTLLNAITDAGTFFLFATITVFAVVCSPARRTATTGCTGTPRTV
jgi:MFS family permease